MSATRHEKGKEKEESLPVNQDTQMISHAYFLEVVTSIFQRDCYVWSCYESCASMIFERLKSAYKRVLCK